MRFSFKKHVLTIAFLGFLCVGGIFSQDLVPSAHAEVKTKYQEFFDGYGKEGDKQNVNKYTSIYDQLTKNASGQDLAPEIVIRNAILFALDILVWVLTAIAVLFIILAGVKMVLDPNGEDAVKKQLNVIRDIAIGMIVIHSARFFVKNIYSDPTANNTNLLDAGINTTSPTPCTSVELAARLCTQAGLDPTTGAQLYTHQAAISDSSLIVNFRDATTPILVSEKVVYPLLNYFFGFVASFAILFIVISTFRIITAQGDPEKVKAARGGLVNTAFGLVVMLLAQYFVKAVYGLPTSTTPRLGPDVAYGIALLMNIANYMLGFMSFIGVVMIIYAGVLIVTAGIKADNKKKGYAIVRQVVIGVIITVSSYAFVATIARLTT